MAERRTTYLGGWRQYPIAAAGHHVQGAAAMWTMLEGPTGVIVAGVVWTGMYLAYQGLSVLRKEDSPGLDVADYMAGAGLVALAQFTRGILA